MVTPVIKKRAGRPRQTEEEQSSAFKQAKSNTLENRADPSLKSQKKSSAAANSPLNIKEKVEKLDEDQLERANNRRKKPNLKPSQWAEAEALWESGEVTLKDLAERFGRDTTVISRHMTLNNVQHGARAEEYSRLIREKIAAELAGDPGENAKRIKAMKEDALKFMDATEKLAWNELVEVKRKGLPMQTIFPNLRAIRELVTIFTSTRTEKWQLMNVIEFESRVEKEDIPELLISELTSDDIERMRIDQLQTASITGEAAPIDFNKINDITEEMTDEELTEEMTDEELSDIVEELEDYE
jgi:hypothetical protein